MPEVLFCGAAGEVTGSHHLIECEGHWIALDCGLFQGRRSEAEEKNRAWPVPPSQLSALLLSHAHTDHTGRVPRLVRDGFDAPIYSTPATRDLCAVMLPDSAHIQEEDVQYVNKRRRRKGLDPIEPLYGIAEAQAAIRMMQSVSYARTFPVIPGVTAEFREAGHMLGSAGILLRFAASGGRPAATLYFTGDVGRHGTPILRDPLPPVRADLIICESTYGNRVNESVDQGLAVLERVVREAVARGGKLIIPAFSVGRTQTIAYYLHQMMTSGTVPRVPVYVDSPLAVSATEVFRLHPDCYDAEAAALLRRHGDFLGDSCCSFIRDVDESKALHRLNGPLVIISASGMCEAGRIRHHLKNNITDPRNTILFPGYQAANTLGRKIVEGAKVITLFHDDYPVAAHVVQINGFSGHADQRDLLNMLTPLASQTPHLALVHGEVEPRDALAQRLRSAGFADVHCPLPGDRIRF